MHPAIIHKSSHPAISTTTRKNHDYARKGDEKEIQGSNDLDIQRSSNPEIDKSRYRKIPIFNGSRNSMNFAIIHLSSELEITTTTRKILDYTKKSEEKELQSPTI